MTYEPIVEIPAYWRAERVAVAAGVRHRSDTGPSRVGPVSDPLQL